ncbi:MAG: response regulator [Candidatus Acidiferrales bacterium]
MPRILVADDNTNIQRMVVLAFQERGLEVITVGNGEAAVRRLPDADPDVVLADVFMPVRNGYEVCEFVKKDARFCHIPVILLVGAFDPMDEKEARRVGADGVLKKPFVPPDPLIAMVMAALEKNPRVVAEMAKAKEAALAAAALAAARPEIPAMAEPKPLPEFPEPTPEEAAVIYGFGKGMRALDSDDEIEEASQASAKTKEAPAPKEPVKSSRAPKESSPSITPVVGDDDADEQAFDPAATASDWRRDAGEFEVPENVAADPIYSYGRNFEPITFPSEQKAPPKHVQVDVNIGDEADAVNASEVPSVENAAARDSAADGSAAVVNGEATPEISADEASRAATGTTDAGPQAADMRAQHSSSGNAAAPEEPKGDDWEIECLPVGETAADTLAAARDQAVDEKFAEPQSRAPARFFTESELTEVAKARRQADEVQPAGNSQSAAWVIEDAHREDVSEPAIRAEEQQPAFAARTDAQIDAGPELSDSQLDDVHQLSSEPTARAEDVEQPSGVSEPAAQSEQLAAPPVEKVREPAGFRHVPRGEEPERPATSPSVVHTEETRRAGKSRFVGTVDELRHKDDSEPAKTVGETHRPVAAQPAARVQEPEQNPARAGFVARVRSWMDMMTPSRVQETDDHWTARLKAPATQQQTDAPSDAQSAAKNSEVEELAKRDAEILAFKRDSLAKKPETPKSQLATPPASRETRAESDDHAIEQLRAFDRDAVISKPEIAAPVVSYEAGEEVHASAEVETHADSDAHAGPDAQVNANIGSQATADAPQVGLPVDSLAQLSAFEPEKEPAASGIPDLSSQLLFAPADAAHNGDFSSEHPPAEPLLVDEDHHEPSDYFSRPEQARGLEHGEGEMGAEQVRAEAAPAELPEPAEPFCPVTGADYWNREPMTANVPGPLFDGAFASEAYDFDGRMLTLPPPNREALSDIPFLMPPLPLAQSGTPSQAATGDTAMVDEVVRKVLEKLQPGLRELLAESMKPLVENMLQEELHKKEK